MDRAVRSGESRVGDSDSAGPGRPVVRVILDRNFGPYLLGNFASNCGTWCQSVAQALLIYGLTRSTLLVGVANFAQFIGVLVVAPWAGAAADRFDRRRLLIFVQLVLMVLAVTLTVISCAGGAGLVVVLVAALLLGLGTAFAMPSMQALVPAMVGRADMRTALAMNTVTFTLARAVGPALGALAVERLGIGLTFGLNALSYLLFSLALLTVRPRVLPVRAARKRATLRATWRTLRRDAVAMLMLVVVACVAFSGDPVNTLTPEFVTQIFHAPHTALGVLIGVFGLGSVLAAFASRRTAGARATVAVMVLMGAATIGFGLATNLVWALMALCVAGFGFLAAQTGATVRLQMRISEHERGRVMALWNVAWLGTRPIASLADGALAYLAGVRAAAVVMALPVLAGAAVLLVARRLSDPATRASVGPGDVA